MVSVGDVCRSVMVERSGCHSELLTGNQNKTWCRVGSITILVAVVNHIIIMMLQLLLSIL